MCSTVFFLSTGYLLARKFKSKNSIDEKKQIVNKTLHKIIKLYVFWNVVYLPLALYEYYFSDKTLLGSYIIYDLFSYIRGFIFMGEHFNSWILWYLLSTIYALLMIQFLIPKNKTIPYICWAGVIVFMVGIFMTYLSDSTGELSKVELMVQKAIKVTFTNGRMTTAFLYIPLGMLMNNMQFSRMKGIFMVVLGIVLYLSPLNNIFILGLFVIPVLTSVGIFLVAINTNLSNNKIYMKLRTASAVMYFMHMWVWSIYGLIINQTLQTPPYGMDGFLVATMVTLFMSGCYIEYLGKH